MATSQSGVPPIQRKTMLSKQVTPKKASDRTESACVTLTEDEDRDSARSIDVRTLLTALFRRPLLASPSAPSVPSISDSSSSRLAACIHPMLRRGPCTIAYARPTKADVRAIADVASNPFWTGSMRSHLPSCSHRYDLAVPGVGEPPPLVGLADGEPSSRPGAPVRGRLVERGADLREAPLRRPSRPPHDLGAPRVVAVDVLPPPETVAVAPEPRYRAPRRPLPSWHNNRASNPALAGAAPRESAKIARGAISLPLLHRSRTTRHPEAPSAR